MDGAVSAHARFPDVFLNAASEHIYWVKVWAWTQDGGFSLFELILSQIYLRV